MSQFQAAAWCAVCLLLVLATTVVAEQTGAINVTTTGNTQPITGLWGSTMIGCAAASDCRTASYGCYLDYDGESVASYSGWCAAVQTGCFHNETVSTLYNLTATGNGYCTNTTSYRTCTNGNWSAFVTCAVGQTCQGGVCAAPGSSSTTTTSGGSSGGASIGSNASFLRFVSYPLLREMLPGATDEFTILITNGNTTQRNLTLSLTGIPDAWVSIAPKIVAIVYPRSNTTFTVSLHPPSDAQVKTYPLHVTAATTNTTVTQSVDISFTLIPTQQAVQENYRPSLANYSVRLEQFKQALATAALDEAQRIRAENLIRFAQGTLETATSALDRNAFTEYDAAIAELNDLMADIEELIGSPASSQSGDSTLLFAIVGVGLAGGVAAFLLWPRHESGFSEAGWLPHTKEPRLAGVRKRLRPEKKSGSYFDDIEKRQSE